MKRVAGILLAACLFSCSENSLLEDNLSGSSVETKTISSENLSYSVNEEGALCFQSGAAFLTLADSLSKLSDQAFRNWEQQIHFKSYRTTTNDMIAQLDQEEGSPTFDKLLQEYAGFVSVGEDGQVGPVIKGLGYRNITNEQGIFYIEGVKNQFSNGRLFAKGKPVSSSPLTRAVGNVLVNYPTMPYTRDNKKKVESSARIYELVGEGSQAPFIQLQLEITVRGYSKGAGGWKKEKTELYVDDVTVRIPGFLSDVVYSGTYSSNGDYTFSIFNFSLSSIVWGGYQPPFEKPLCLHYRARTRSTGNYGIAYNFYHGVFFNVANVTPNNPGCDKHILVTYNK